MWLKPECYKLCKDRFESMAAALNYYNVQVQLNCIQTSNSVDSFYRQFCVKWLSSTLDSSFHVAGHIFYKVHITFNAQWLFWRTVFTVILNNDNNNKLYFYSTFQNWSFKILYKNEQHDNATIRH